MTRPSQPRLDQQLGDLSPNKVLATVRERQNAKTTSNANTSTASR